MKNQFSAYIPQSKRCSLCSNEKLKILDDKENNLLDRKFEVISKCRHQSIHYELLHQRFKTLASHRNKDNFTSLEH